MVCLLEKAGLDGFCSWAMFQRHRAGRRCEYDPEIKQKHGAFWTCSSLERQTGNFWTQNFLAAAPVSSGKQDSVHNSVNYTENIPNLYHQVLGLSGTTMQGPKDWLIA